MNRYITLLHERKFQYSNHLNMMLKVTSALLIWMKLLMDGTALQCHVCKEVKENGEINNGKSVACVDENGTGVFQDCGEAHDACTSASMSYQVSISGVMTEAEQTIYGCGSKPAEEAGLDALCAAYEEILDTEPGFNNFECSSEYCQTDLCNCHPDSCEPDAGLATQTSLLLLAASITLFGLFL